MMTLERFHQATDESIDAKVKAFNAELTRHYREARNQIQGELDKLYARVLDGVPEGKYYEEMMKYDRLTKLQGQVRTAYLQAARRAGVAVNEAAQLAMSNSFYASQYATSLAANTAQGVKIRFTRLPTELVELAVSGASERFTELQRKYADRFGDIKNYKPAHGSTLRDILLTRRGADLKRVQDTVVQSLIQGKSVRQATSDLTRTMAISRNNASRIILTETHRTRALGHYAASQNAKAEGVNLRRMIVSVLDDSTRPQSAQVDGQYEDDNGEFTYPGGVKVIVPGNSGVPGWDINDRERTIDIVDGWEPETRRARNPETGENDIIGMKSFKSWADEVGLKENKYGQLYT